jgi:hypothetical protein
VTADFRAANSTSASRQLFANSLQDRPEQLHEGGRLEGVLSMQMPKLRAFAMGHYLSFWRGIKRPVQTFAHKS